MAAHGHRLRVECKAGRIPESWAAGLASTNTICVHVGAEIAINVYPPQLHEWPAASGSGLAVAAVATSGANQERAMSVTLNALRTGPRAVNAAVQAKDGAPDPQPASWQLVTTVVV
jgi:hypothetical protein